MTRKHTLWQFVKYGVVGVGNTVIQLVTYVVLFKVLGVHYIVASTIGYVLGAANSYMLNRHWTFRATGMSHAQSLPRFALVQGTALAANDGILYLLVDKWGVEKILAQVLTTLVIVTATFVVNRAWSFSHRTAPQPTGQ